MAISKIVTNSLANNAVTDAKLTTALGTIVSDLENSVAILGLKEAISENRVAGNLGNAFIDIFQDASGIDAIANSSWRSDEYVSANIVSESYGTLISVSQSNFNSRGRETWSGNNVTFNSAPDVDAGIQSAGGASPIELSANTPFQFQVKTGANQYGPYPSLIPYSAGTTSYSQENLSSLLGAVRIITGSLIEDSLTYYNGSVLSYPAGVVGADAFRDKTVLFRRSAAGVLQIFVNGSQIGNNTNILTSGYQMWMAGQGGHTSSLSNIMYSNGVPGTAASNFNFTGTTQTASYTVNRMGIVILYNNVYGTATLNTDIVVELSANGGSNYTTGTLTDGGTFSSGIKIAIANPVTITNTGTSPKYRLSVNNIANLSKEVEIWGIGLLY